MANIISKISLHHSCGYYRTSVQRGCSPHQSQRRNAQYVGHGTRREPAQQPQSRRYRSGGLSYDESNKSYREENKTSR